MWICEYVNMWVIIKTLTLGYHNNLLRIYQQLQRKCHNRGDRNNNLFYQFR